MRFANVCNVRGLPFYVGRQKQNLSSKSIFQLYVLFLVSIFLIYVLLFLFLRLAGNGLAMPSSRLFGRYFLSISNVKIYKLFFLRSTELGYWV